MYHIDAYRLDTMRDFEMLGFDDLCHPGSVVMIEWADKVMRVLQGIEHITVTLAYGADNHRHIVLANAPEYITIVSH